MSRIEVETPPEAPRNVPPGESGEPDAAGEGVGEKTRSYFRRHPRAKWLLVGLLLAGLAGGIPFWRYLSSRESTDDAQVDGHIHWISARVTGHVIAVLVDDNTAVNTGDVLVRVDPKDYQVALDRALADLASAEAALRAAQVSVPIRAATTESQLRNTQAAVHEAIAAVAEAERDVAAARARLSSAQAASRQAAANHAKAAGDLERYRALVAKEDISKQQFDEAVAGADATRAALDASKAAIEQAEHELAGRLEAVAQERAKVVEAETDVQAARTGPLQVKVSTHEASQAAATVQLRQAAVEEARLNLSYTAIYAPVNGVVGKKSVERGQNVQPGQTLMSVVPLDDIWITANFKETQLRNMRTGQKAVIKVDAYGGRQYRGYVESFSAATGAQFSILPPENATGNYVKVVQRVPVRIAIEKGQDPAHVLRIGLSVEPTVFVSSGK